jgi:hypothetical protein
VHSKTEHLLIPVDGAVEIGDLQAHDTYVGGGGESITGR